MKGFLKMLIYDKNGYVNIHEILSKGYPYNFIVGGRGTGKTYGALLEAIKEKRRFMLLRRTQSQTDLICKSEFSPFKSINNDIGSNIQPKSISRYNVGFYDDNNELIGYGAALSTFSNLRGFDSSDIDLLIYDEFIPEKHERPIKGEGEAFANVIETIGRNRELQEQNPLQVLCLANANDLGNPIFAELNLINVAQKMKKKKRNVYANGERGILLVMLENSPISKKKEKTSLYKLMAGSNFSKMALDNEFTSDDLDAIKSLPIIEYKPLCNIGKICIYEHKSNRSYYITSHRSGTPPEFGTSAAEKARFYKTFGDAMRAAYSSGKIVYETYNDKQNFEAIF